MEKTTQTAQAAKPAANEPVIAMTATASAHMLKLLKNEPDFTAQSGVRVQMIPGGCSGMKYDFQFASEAGPGEITEEHHGLKLFIPGSWTHFLRGTNIDYTENLSGSGFAIENPNTKKSCGCGKSVC